MFPAKRIILLPFFLVLLVSSCKQKSEQKAKQQIDPGFSDYISGFTSGIISSQSGIKVIFDEPPKTAKREGDPTNLFEFSPSVKGKAEWVNDRTLEFKPENRLSSNQEFEAELQLGKLMEVPDKYKTFSFNFKTVKQNFSVSLTGLSAYDNQNLEEQQLKGEVTTADFVSEENITGLLTARQNDLKLPVSWSTTADGQTHYFTVDSINRTKQTEKIALKFDGKAIKAGKEITKTYEVPPLSEFKVMDVAVKQQPEQQVIVRFSDPLDESQDLRGLVRFKESLNPRFIVSGNKLKIFPAEQQQGSSKINIEPSLKNSLGYRLGTKFSSTVSFFTPKPEVTFTGKGTILPSSDGLVIPFKAVSLRAVDLRIIRIFEDNVPQFLQVNHMTGDKELKRVGRIIYHEELPLDDDKSISLTQWNTFKLDLSKFIETEPGAIYQVQLNFNKSQSLYNCGGEDEEEEESFDKKTDFTIVEKNENDVRYWDWNGFNRVDYREPYDWSERDNPCSDSYYKRYNQAVSKNVLASNLGIIAKQGETNELRINVSNLITTKPESGVSVRVYNFQHRLVGQGKTDGKGRVSLQLDSKGFLVIAQKDKEFGYLRIDDGSSLSMSMFDVGGTSTQHGVKGFLYGERGVWRPGDSLFISLMLEDKNDILPEKHPVVFELTDPHGKLVSRKVTPVRSKGLFVFRSKTKKDAPTGHYTLKAKLGGLVFGKIIRIETVKPNRLKMDLDFRTEMITHDAKDLEGKLTVEWLHGATASNARADVEMKATPAKTDFKRYHDFSFTDPSVDYTSRAKTIFDGKVNQQGSAHIKPDIDLDGKAPGMMNLNFQIRAFENSGEFSTTRKTVKYSPYGNYVGIKVPEGEGWNGALRSTKKHSIPVVTVDENGEPVDRKVKIFLYKIDWRWWWENSSNRDLSRFVASRHSKVFQKGVLITDDGEGAFNFKMEERFWGRILIRVVDMQSGHSTGALAMMDYPGWWEDRGSGTPGGATKLSFSFDEDSYKTGDKARVKIPSSGSSRILVSVENNTRVLHSEWIASQKRMTQYEFDVTPEMAPNAYVFVSLVQPHNQTTNDRPIRLYGVEPLFVENPESHLHPEIDMPGELAPEKPIEITVSEKNDRPMQYTLAVVDEGLLDITAFKTPDPWGHFFARKALGVKTWDLYDEVIGAFGGEYAALLKPGGGVEIDPDAGKHSANRFKPVVKFFGPFTLDKNKKRTHRFTMPNYVGSVRTMVIAMQDDAYGNAQETTPVKKPLMTLATAPRIIRPGEEMDVPVTVFAMDDDIKEVEISLSVNENFQIVGEKQKKITFSQTGDKITVFKVRAIETLGVGELDVVAEGDGETATYNMEMNILPSNPTDTRSESRTIAAGDTASLSYKTFGIEETSDVVVEVSSLVPLNLQKRMDYLTRYPHGCIEQVVSVVFPQLYLSTFMDLSSEKQKEIQDNIKAALDKIPDYQRENGGFSYWPSSNGRISKWATSYAGHFLIEARQKGYKVPEGVVRNWLTYQQRAARNWSSYLENSSYARLIQAYRLYTMALAGEASAGDMNRLREEDKLSLVASWRLAAAYALAGKTSVAEKLTGRLKAVASDYDNPGPTYGSGLRDMAMILETLTLLQDRERGMELMRDVARRISDNSWHSTQTTAYSLLAIAKFVREENLDKPVRFEYKLNDKEAEKTVATQPLVQLHPDVMNNPQGQVRVVNDGESSLYVRTITSGIPPAGMEQRTRSDLNMQVTYIDMAGNSVNPKRVEQGTDLIVEVKIAHPGVRDDYEEMALTQIFPSGWEIRNMRLSEFNSKMKPGDKPEYRDIRDDRVYTYFGLERHESKTFRVMVNAAYTGKYYLPGLKCEAMYDNSISATNEGQWVEVVKPGE
ncbi:MAG: hypothetical protein K9J27_01775 [Bacteroidales bacterium]|nr:hypothetical protein [Bacteroidales bacterium]MCF8332565.1 hypothetical protein [Bacteroidales bacterium]